MNQVFGTAVLVIATLFCLLTTWRSGTEPNLFAERLGLTVANPGGVNEIRAQYAGFFLVVALLCGASLAGYVSRPVTFTVLIVVFGGLLAGRLVSFLVDGGMTGYGVTIRALYAIDAVGFALALSARLSDSSA